MGLTRKKEKRMKYKITFLVDLDEIDENSIESGRERLQDVLEYEVYFYLQHRNQQQTVKVHEITHN